ncbi:MAG: CHC2 zinc finger domain-containing protein [Chloroflexales bacterium]
MPPTYTLDDYRRHADLVAIASRYTDLSAVRHDETHRGVCPLHHGATNPTSFHVYTGDTCQRFACYSCGAEGDVFAFLAAKTGMSYADALAEWKRSGDHMLLLRGDPVPLRPARPKIEVLPPRQQIVEQYRALLHQTSSLNVRAYDWWKARGLSAATIDRFRLGYAPVCPTLPQTDSFSIPVLYRDTVLNIRHRLANPPANKGNKYRPQKAGLGVHLFNADALEIVGADSVLIVEGEIKAMVLCDLGIEDIMPVVSSTAGNSSWLRGHGETWYDYLHEFSRVYVLFDNEPDAWDIAQRTGKLFGRRGRIVSTPGKVDDFVLAGGTRLSRLLNAIADAKPAVRL